MDDPDYPRKLRLAALVTEPALRRAIAALELPEGSQGLDAGCGTGRHALWLAESVGPRGRVIGVDISANNLAAARALAAGSQLSAQLDFVLGDVLALPFPSARFDWLWCADTLWPVAVAPDPVAGVRELARVVRPDGAVTLAYWSSHNLLPGYPALEARLAPAFVAAVPYLADVPPEQHFLRARGWLEAAGLEGAVARTFVADIAAPFTIDLREGLAHCVQMLWGSLEPSLAPDDWRTLRLLSDPAAPASLLNLPDYYGFVTYTVFCGRVPR